MPLGVPGRPQEPLHVLAMAFALVIASFAGAAIGLVWQSSGFGEEELVEQVQGEGGEASAPAAESAAEREASENADDDEDGDGDPGPSPSPET